MQIVSILEQLGTFPMSGRAGRVPGIRQLVISNTMAYAAIHGAQHWPDGFKSSSTGPMHLYVLFKRRASD